MRLELTLNGAPVRAEISDDAVLADVLRETFGLTGVKIGCREGECGACTVLLDERPVNACLVLAATVSGHSVVTIEGLRDDPLARRLMELLAEGGAVQCGFCTPGMVISGYALLSGRGELGAREVREGIAGNLCRCTGYQKIEEAILRCKEELR